MYSFKNGQMLRSEWYWKSKPYNQVCLIPDCEIELGDRAHEWAHTKFHIKDNKRQLKQLAYR